jgi:hypothetical protein
MTRYLNFRESSVGGAVVSPYVIEGNGTISPTLLTPVPFEAIGALVGGKNLLFGVHGFNVSYQQGAASLGYLDAALGLTGSDVFLGVLWPGDSWVPYVNYPFEGEVSIACGRYLADFCNSWAASAQSVSFVSHSLGARLVLEAVQRLSRPARSVCLTAGAINCDCMSTEYAAAAGNSNAISILASHNDWVLELAYPIADPIALLLHDDHTPFELALGYNGPPTPAPPQILHPWQIPDPANYGHSDYLPPVNGLPGRWTRVADFMANAYRRLPQPWP